MAPYKIITSISFFIAFVGHTYKYRLLYEMMSLAAPSRAGQSVG